MFIKSIKSIKTIKSCYCLILLSLSLSFLLLPFLPAIANSANLDRVHSGILLDIEKQIRSMKGRIDHQSLMATLKEAHPSPEDRDFLERYFKSVKNDQRTYFRIQRKGSTFILSHRGMVFHFEIRNYFEGEYAINGHSFNVHRYDSIKELIKELENRPLLWMPAKMSAWSFSLIPSAYALAESTLIAIKAVEWALWLIYEPMKRMGCRKYFNHDFEVLREMSEILKEGTEEAKEAFCRNYKLMVAPEAECLQEIQQTRPLLSFTNKIIKGLSFDLLWVPQWELKQTRFCEKATSTDPAQMKLLRFRKRTATPPSYAGEEHWGIISCFDYYKSRCDDLRKAVEKLNCQF